VKVTHLHPASLGSNSLGSNSAGTQISFMVAERASGQNYSHAPVKVLHFLASTTALEHGRWTWLYRFWISITSVRYIDIL